MPFTLADQYYLKARQNFGFDMEASTQDLTYALSYDPDHAGANFLMGCYCLWYLHDYDAAEFHFSSVVVNNPQFREVYTHYAKLLVSMEAYNKADKLIDYGLTIDGVCKSNLLQKKALLKEAQGQYKEAKKLLKSASKLALDQYQLWSVEDDQKRLKKKMSSNKKKKSKKSKKKRKK